jgi:hypothetical protein
MRIAFAIAFTVLTACHPDGALAPPPRVASTIKIDGPTALSGSTLVVIDGVTITSLRDLQRLAELDPETITVYKGPAASHLYSSHPCAAIVITTKHAAHPTQR